MIEIPNLAGVATKELVEQIGGSGFKASYINWARTMQLLREHAPGWLPEIYATRGGENVHKAPVGGYLLIGFSKGAERTPPVPQAIMDNRNNAVPWEEITARDISDTHRRGICLAAALTFGLAYELWAKMPLETGYAEQEKPAGKPQDGMRLQDLPEARQAEVIAWKRAITKASETIDVRAAAAEWSASESDLSHEERVALWGELDSKLRSGIKAEMKNA